MKSLFQSFHVLSQTKDDSDSLDLSRLAHEAPLICTKVLLLALARGRGSFLVII